MILKTISVMGFFLSSLLAGGVSAYAEDAPKALKEKLFVRYDQKNLTVMVPGKFRVTALNGTGGNALLDYSINYDHFDPSFSNVSWPKKYESRNLLDEHTTEEVAASAQFTDPLGAG